MARAQLLTVQALSRRKSVGILTWGALRLTCALGRGGCSWRKREGDGATPLGRFRLVNVHYRPDRGPRPSTGLPVRPLRPNDGWCDAPADRNYNRAVQLPYPSSAEALWRRDALYDIVVVLDHNTRPRLRDRGSAIFLHVAHPDYPPTHGCIALSAADLRRLLARLCGNAQLQVRV